MIVYAVDVKVKKGFENDFIKACGENRKGTRTEPGNYRFDVTQSSDDSSVFFLYEVYASEDAVKAHKETAHYLKWRDAVADWMEIPRSGRKFNPVFPEGEREW